MSKPKELVCNHSWRWGAVNVKDQGADPWLNQEAQDEEKCQKNLGRQVRARLCESHWEHEVKDFSPYCRVEIHWRAFSRVCPVEASSPEENIFRVEAVVMEKRRWI